MSAPATNDPVPSPVNTTTATSSRRDRWSTTVTSSSSARSLSALTGGLATVTTATRALAAIGWYCTRRKRQDSKRRCDSLIRWRSCQVAIARAISSIDSGLRRVLVSPTGWPSTSARSMRRMYLPLRVSGNAPTSMKSAGTAVAPFSLRTSSASRRRSSAVRRRPATGFTKASGVRPFSRCGAPTTIALPTGESGLTCLSRRIAPSISSVPMRCPDTLITSSLRPCSEKPPSSKRTAKSPWV